MPITIFSIKLRAESDIIGKWDENVINGEVAIIAEISVERIVVNIHAPNIIIAIRMVTIIAHFAANAINVINNSRAESLAITRMRRSITII
ncbi:hypothetical protein [Desulfobacterium sp. N47]|uniref:hypothetical protein n=1 Tax=Desulfobacterium sp. N47 TaxID=3115210 RepID=UPI003F4A6FD5